MLHKALCLSVSRESHPPRIEPLQKPEGQKKEVLGVTREGIEPSQKHEGQKKEVLGVTREGIEPPRAKRKRPLTREGIEP